MSYRIAKKGGQLIAATFADFETADNFIKHRPDSLPDATILLDCDDSYQWVGITQKLAEYDELKLDYDMVNGQAEEFTKIIEKLAAELERVKAERDDLQIERDKYKNARDNWYKDAIKYLKERNSFHEELSALKSRLPVNADGEKVWFGDKVWWNGPTPVNPASFVVAVITYNEENKSWRFNGGDDKVYLTAESCCAANGGGKDNE